MGVKYDFFHETNATTGRTCLNKARRKCTKSFGCGLWTQNEKNYTATIQQAHTIGPPASDRSWTVAHLPDTYFRKKTRIGGEKGLDAEARRLALLNNGAEFYFVFAN